MKVLAVLLAALATPLSLAGAQVAPVGPFTGGNSEDFESLALGQYTCHPTRILQGTAMLCATGTATIIVAGSSHCTCSLFPQTATHAFAGGAGYATIWFAVPAVRFGGYFGLNCAVPDGTARFFAASGAVIATVPLAIPADCQYHWLG